MIALLRRLRRHPIVKDLGPGLITGAADDDQSGIATYSQAGAQLGYQMLWTAAATYPLMVGIQPARIRNRPRTRGEHQAAFAALAPVFHRRPAAAGQYDQRRRRYLSDGPRGEAAGGRASACVLGGLRPDMPAAADVHALS